MKLIGLCLAACVILFSGSAFAQGGPPNRAINDTVTIYGAVTDSTTQNPIAQALVLVTAGAGFNPSVVGSTMTDNQGNYSLANVILTRFGTRRLTVTKSGYVDAFQDVPFNPSDSVQMDFALAPFVPTGDTSMVSGMVKDSTTGQPISGVYVAAFVTTQRGLITDTDTLGSTTSDAQGKYSMTLISFENSVDFIAAAQGYASQTMTNVTLDSQFTVDFVLLAEQVPQLIAVTSPTTERRPTLSWHALAGTNAYTVIVDSVGDFRTPFIITQTADTFFTPLIDLPLGTIYWQVVSDVNPTGFSNVGTFEVQPLTGNITKEITLPSAFRAVLSPNPSANVFKIDLPVAINSVSIFDLAGNKVEKISINNNLDASTAFIRHQLQKGIYIIKVNEGAFTGRFLVIE